MSLYDRVVLGEGKCWGACLNKKGQAVANLPITPSKETDKEIDQSIRRRDAKRTRFKAGPSTKDRKKQRMAKAVERRRAKSKGMSRLDLKRDDKMRAMRRKQKRETKPSNS